MRQLTASEDIRLLKALIEANQEFAEGFLKAALRSMASERLPLGGVAENISQHIVSVVLLGAHLETETEEMILGFAIAFDRPDMARVLLEKFHVSQAEVQKAFLASIKADRQQIFETIVSYGVNINAEYCRVWRDEGVKVEVILTPVNQALSSTRCDVVSMVSRLVELGLDLNKRLRSSERHDYSDMEVGALVYPTAFERFCPEQVSVRLALVAHRGPQEVADFILTNNIPIAEQERLTRLAIVVCLEYSEAHGVQVRAVRNLLEATIGIRTSPYIIETGFAEVCRYVYHDQRLDRKTDIAKRCTDLIPVILDFGADLASDSVSEIVANGVLNATIREYVLAYFKPRLSKDVAAIVGAQLLCLAAAAGDADFTRLLLEFGVDINVVAQTRSGNDTWGYGTPLGTAAAVCGVDMMQILWDKGARFRGWPNPCIGFEELGIVGKWEAHSPDEKLAAVSWFLAHGASPDRLDDTDSHVVSPSALLSAVEDTLSRETASFEVIKLLVNHGANINRRAYTRRQCTACGPWAVTPLQQACQYGRLDIVQYFVENGGDIHVPPTKRTLTALQYAAGSSNSDLVEYLLGRGADPNERRACGGRTALEAAAMRGDLRTAILLLEAGARVNPFKVNSSCAPCACNKYPIERAAMNEQWDMVELLIKAEKDDDPTRQERLARSAEIAQKYGYHRIVKSLKEAMRN